MRNVISATIKAVRSLSLESHDYEPYREEFEETHKHMKFERTSADGDYLDHATQEEWLKWSRLRFREDTAW